MHCFKRQYKRQKQRDLLGWKIISIAVQKANLALLNSRKLGTFICKR